MPFSPTWTELQDDALGKQGGHTKRTIFSLLDVQVKNLPPQGFIWGEGQWEAVKGGLFCFLYNHAYHVCKRYGGERRDVQGESLTVSE